MSCDDDAVSSSSYEISVSSPLPVKRKKEILQMIPVVEVEESQARRRRRTVLLPDDGDPSSSSSTTTTMPTATATVVL